MKIVGITFIDAKGVNHDSITVGAEHILHINLNKNMMVDLVVGVSGANASILPYDMKGNYIITVRTPGLLKIYLQTRTKNDRIRPLAVRKFCVY